MYHTSCVISRIASSVHIFITKMYLQKKAIKGMGAALSRINELRGLNILQGREYCENGRVKADLSFVNFASSNETEELAESELSTFRWSKIRGLAEVSSAMKRNRCHLCMQGQIIILRQKKITECACHLRA